MEKAKWDHIIAEIARDASISPDQVRKEMQDALNAAFASSDPKVQAAWDRVPRGGKIPTLEELLDYVYTEVTRRTI